MVQSALVKVAWGITFAIAAKQNKHKVSDFIGRVNDRFKRALDFVTGKGKKAKASIKKAYEKVENSKAGQEIKKQYDKALAQASNYRQKLIELGYENIEADEMMDKRMFLTSSTDPPNFNYSITSKTTEPSYKFKPRTKDEKLGFVDHEGKVTIKGYLKNISKALSGDRGEDGKVKKPSWFQRTKENMERRKLEIEAEKEAAKLRGKKDRKGSFLGKLFSSPLSFFVGLYMLPFKLIGNFLFGKLFGGLGTKIGEIISNFTTNIKLFIKEGVKLLVTNVGELFRKFSTALGTGLKNLGLAIWNRRPKWLKDMWQNIKKNWRIGRRWRRRFGKSLGTRFKDLKTSIGKYLGGLGDKVTTKLGWLGGKISEKFGWLGEKMKGWFNTLGKQLMILGDKITSSKLWGKAKGFFGAKGLGGRALGWIGTGIANAARFGGMVLSGPVGWGLAIGMALWGGYTLYKLFKGKDAKFPDTPAGRISQLRMYSYGLSMKENTKFKKIFELEEVVGKFMRREDDGTVTTLDLDLETRNKIGEIFEVDFENPDGSEEYLSRWLRERFFPAYREFLRVLWNQDRSKKPGELDSLNRTQLAHIAYDYDPPGRIWEFKHLPFSKPRKSSMTIKEFKNLQDTIQNELSIEWESIQSKLTAEQKTKMRNINERAKNKTSMNASEDRLTSLDRTDKKLSSELRNIISPEDNTYLTVDEQIDALLEKEGYFPPNGKDGPMQLYIDREKPWMRDEVIRLTTEETGEPLDIDTLWEHYSKHKRLWKVRGKNPDPEHFRQWVKGLTFLAYRNAKLSNEGFIIPESMQHELKNHGGKGVSYIPPAVRRRMEELERKKRAIRDAAMGAYIPTETNVKVDMNNYQDKGQVSFKLVGGDRSANEAFIFGSNKMAHYDYFDNIKTPFGDHNPIQKNEPYGGYRAFGTSSPASGRYGAISLPEFRTDEKVTTFTGNPSAIISSGKLGSMGIGPETPPFFTDTRYPNKIIDSTLEMGDPNGIGLMSLDEVFKLASQTTGVPEPILWAFAKLESSLNPVVKAPGKGNTATGLLQMTKAAWKTMLEWHGKKYGLNMSNANRYNPLHNVLLGAEFIKGNMKSIAGYKSLGIDLPTALYAAHFFGPTGVKTFFSALKNRPDALMENIMESATNSNPTLLKGKTPIQVLEHLKAKIHGAINDPAENWSGYKKLKQAFPNLYRNSKPGDRDMGQLLEVGDGKKPEGLDKTLDMLNDSMISGQDAGQTSSFGLDSNYSMGNNPYDNVQSFIDKGPPGAFSQLLSDMNLTDHKNGGVYDGGRPSEQYNTSTNTPYDTASLRDYAGEKEILGEDYGKSETLAVSVHPIKVGYPFYFTSLFGPRNTGIKGASTTHKGVDIGVPSKKAGTPIVATGPGKVWRAYNSKSYGLVVYILHNDGYQTRYAHLDKILVREGQEVNAGDLVGLMGNTGVGSGVHLHYEVRKGHGQWSPAVDPFNFSIIKNSYKGPKVPTVIEENGRVDSNEDLTEDNQQQSILMNMGVEPPPNSLEEALIQRDPVTGQSNYQDSNNDIDDSKGPEDESGITTEDKSQELKVDVDVNTTSLERSLEENNKAIRELIEVMVNAAKSNPPPPNSVVQQAQQNVKGLNEKVLSDINPTQTSKQPMNGESVRASQAIRFNNY